MLKKNQIISFVLIIIFVSSCGKNPENKLKSAILNEEWANIYNICNESKFSNLDSCIFNTIKSHAGLSQNKNNESLELFLSVNNNNDKENWYKWTQEMVNQNPESAIYQYFLGDAKARLGNWNDAIKTYDNALKYSDKDFTKAMIYNAIGVAYVNLDMSYLDTAFKKLDIACSLEKNIADIYANLGTISIKKGQADLALNYFNIALTKSKNFDLALNGRGCAYYIKSTRNDLKNSFKDFDSALVFSPINEITKHNIKCLFPFLNDSLEIDTSKIGMYLETEKLRKMSTSEVRKKAIIWEKVKDFTELYKGGSSEFNFKFKGFESRNKLTPIMDNLYKIADEKSKMYTDTYKDRTGGVEMESLKFAIFDPGNYPVKNWFGLFQSKN